MRSASLITTLAVLGTAAALPRAGQPWRRQDNETEPEPLPPLEIPLGPNPFEGRTLFANPGWASKLDQTKAAFKAAGDEENAAKTEVIQKVGTFAWVPSRAQLSNIDAAIAGARAVAKETGEKLIVGLVLYNLPDRDCSAGESAGELIIAENGLEIYKEEYIKPFAQKVTAASDITFAIVLEPDSLANGVTNLANEKCAGALSTYVDGIAHAIKSLQAENVHLYMDAAHGGWLGWDGNLAPSAKLFAEVVRKSGNNTRIRGFATNVSNYNPFNATVRENYTEWSNSWDEGHYAASLAPHLEKEGLPAKFIIDQGRVHLPGARKEWGEWCNVSPAGFGGAAPIANNTLVDSLVWIKPGGESDGECGMAGAPRAGEWFEEYAEMLVKNADPSLFTNM